jgi:hypothetical protein
VNKQSIVGGLLILGAALFLTGCSGTDPNSMIAEANDMNVKRLATAYSFYHLKNKFKGPKNEADFKKFIAEQDPARMELAGIDVNDVDSLFVGERDNLSLKIRYGLNTRVRGPSLPVVFEDTGVEGLRHVGFTNGSMQEVEAVEYDQLFSGKRDNEKVDENRD